MDSIDYLVIGGGVVGLTLARALQQRQPSARILIIEKERQIAQHASGRNSGVLHAGFYYTADSLKARFTREGNLGWRRFCREHRLKIHDCGKLVVAKDASELEGLSELKRRADRNGVTLEWMDALQVQRIDDNVRTHERALYSPTTATIDPVAVCTTVARELRDSGVEIRLGTRYLRREGDHIRTNKGPIGGQLVINCAGQYADRIARDYGFCEHKVILPFKGLYLKYNGTQPPVRTNVYPVPNLANPFLGVHYTVTVDQEVKIGPTAIPAFWRENYGGFSRIRLSELFEVGWHESRLFLTNASGFRDLALDELKKYRRSHFLDLAQGMVKGLDRSGFKEWTRPGIRAQLLDTRTRTLVQDFLVEGDTKSLHVLNAVSPAFTCALPMAAYISDRATTAHS